MKTIVPEPVSSKQYDILVLLLRFRFLNRIQIQHFLHHKSDTRITAWLKDMTDRRIISRIYSKTREGMIKPAIYYLGLKSRPVLLKGGNYSQKLLKRVYREKESSPTFQEHWQFIADLYFHFQNAINPKTQELYFLTATDLSEYAYLPLTLPDAYISIKEKEQTKRYFVEVFDGLEKWANVDRRIKRFVAYYKAQYWQTHVEYPFPKIFLIFPHQKLKIHAQELIKKQLRYENVDIQFFLGIQADIQQRGIREGTWEAIK